jgi:uncharacterized membrane protein
MSVYFSVLQIPELADLSETQRLYVLARFNASRRAASFVSINFFEIALVGSVVLGEIVGLFGGWFYWRGFWGALIGGILAMCVVMAAYFFVGLLCITFPRIREARRYFRSDGGLQLIERAKRL